LLTAPQQPQDLLASFINHRWTVERDKLVHLVQILPGTLLISKPYSCSAGKSLMVTVK
jgi:hypothetical protein